MTREKLSALRHKGYITDAEYKEIISALEQKPSDNGMAVMPTHCRVCGKPLGVFDGQICAECQKPCDDAISRQSVLDAISRIGLCKCSTTEIQAVDECLREVEDSPTVTQKWIPVSERLPENHKDVLICLSSDEICIGCYNSHRLPFSNNAIGWGASYTHNWCSNDVIAWMPLPKPYVPQERGEKE